MGIHIDYRVRLKFIRRKINYQNSNKKISNEIVLLLGFITQICFYLNTHTLSSKSLIKNFPFFSIISIFSCLYNFIRSARCASSIQIFPPAYTMRCQGIFFVPDMDAFPKMLVILCDAITPPPARCASMP